MAEKEAMGKTAKTRNERPPLRESPFPPLGASLARGFRVVGSSPDILGTAFLSLLLTWALFVVVGVEHPPGALSLLLAVPPAQTLFTDAPLVLVPTATGTEVAVTIGMLAALRGVTLGLMCLLILQALRAGKTSLAGAVRLLPRTALVLAALYLLEFGMVVAAYRLLGQFLGQLTILVIPVALFFLLLAPAVAAAEGEGPLPALRRGVRAARLPGTRHLSMVMVYFLVLIYAGTIAPFGILTPATLSIGVWAYGLVMTFVHASVLAALVYRWLEVRDKVPATPGPRGA